MARNIENQNLPFSQVFPRFSYRWIYDDGEISPYAPFTEAAFLPGIPNDEEQTAEGENSSMCNAATSILVHGIPRGGPDVVAIEVVYTESISSAVYELDTIQIPEADRGGTDTELLFLEERIFGSAIPPNQLIRPFDNVPRLAKSQEITTNRLLYGNYVQNYDQPTSITMDTNTEPVAGAANGPSVKTNRSYQVGVAYIDKYGRQGGLLAGHETGITTEFNYSGRTKLTANITSTAPSWATHYRYFVKDIGGDYHNLVATAIYNDGDVTATNSANVWLSFNSNDRNKIIDNTILVPKRSLAGTTDVVYQEESRHSILDIENEAPSVVRRNISEREASLVAAVDNVDYEVNAWRFTSDVNIEDLELWERGTFATGAVVRFEGVIYQLPPSVGKTVVDTLPPSQDPDWVVFTGVGAGTDNAFTIPQGITSFTLESHTSGFEDTSLLSGINAYLVSQELDPITETSRSRTLTDVTSPLIVQFGLLTNNAVEVLGIDFNSAASPQTMRLTLGNRTNQDGNIIPDGGRGLVESLSNRGTGGAISTFRFYSSEVSDEGLERVQGHFFVRVPRSRGTVQNRILTSGQTTFRVLEPSTTSEISSCFDYTIAVTGSIAAVIRYTNVAGGVLRQVVTPRTSVVLRSYSTPVLDNPSAGTTATITQGEACLMVTSGMSEGDLNLTWFETEPIVDENIDLYWEASGTYPIADHGTVNTVDWTNVIATVDGVGDQTGIYVESINLFDRFNDVNIGKGVRVNTPQERFSEERRRAGIIWSGVYNSRTELNRLNQFIQAEGIIKELEPNYGSIQKLHTRDTNLIAFCEEKVFRILADKDQLTDPGSGSAASLVAANVVLGQTTPFIGEFGISQNPESFASYGQNIWFTDANTGSVMQLTPGNGQLYPISNRGMNDFFRDRFASANSDFKAVGSFNDYKNSYILSITNYNQNDPIIGEGIDSFVDEGQQTVAYDLDNERFPSRYSFIQEMGASLGNRFYTWSNGRIWLHNSTNVPRNNFHGVQSETTWDIIVTAESPSVVKNFVSLGYEGDAGWELVELSTETENSSVLLFIEKEDKFYGAISGTVPQYSVAGSVGSTAAQSGDIIDNGFILRLNGQTTRTSGIKGLYATVRVRHTSEEPRELHAINTTFFESSS